MDAFDSIPSRHNAEADPAPPCEAEPTALWLALEADWRARDERTERLRTMRLIGGEDDVI